MLQYHPRNVNGAISRHISTNVCRDAKEVPVLSTTTTYKEQSASRNGESDIPTSTPLIRDPLTKISRLPRYRTKILL